MLDLVLITVCYYVAYRLRFEGHELDHVPAVLHRVAAGRARLQARLRCTARGSISDRGRRSACAIVRRRAARRADWDRCCPCSRPRHFYRFEGFSRVVLHASTRCCSTVAIIDHARVVPQHEPRRGVTRSKRSRRVLVYGAGAFGQLLVREMRANPHWHMNPVAFIDDDPMKAHRWIMRRAGARRAGRSSRRRCAATRSTK